MGTNDTRKERTPQLIDIILEDHRKASEEISNMLQAMIDDAKEGNVTAAKAVFDRVFGKKQGLTELVEEKDKTIKIE